MVVPCGTSSVEALENLRQTYNLHGDIYPFRLWSTFRLWIPSKR